MFLTLEATDKDSPAAPNITYSLEVTDEPFTIDPSSGKLSITSPGLDFEAQKTHVITVVALDFGNPPLSALAIINVTVRDVNDNRPQFLVKPPSGGFDDALSCSQDGANCTVYVHDGQVYSVHRGLVQLNATDADGKGNGAPFVFRILNGNTGGKRILVSIIQYALCFFSFIARLLQINFFRGLRLIEAIMVFVLFRIVLFG